MLDKELMLKVQKLIEERYQSMEELEHRKEEIEKQLDDLSAKLKSKQAVADFAKFKKMRSDYADARAYLDLVEKQIAESKTVAPEKCEEVENVLRELDHQIIAVKDTTSQKLKDKADEIMGIVEEDADVQSEYFRAFEDLKIAYGINNISSAMGTYSVYKYGNIRGIYSGFTKLKSE